MTMDLAARFMPAWEAKSGKAGHGATELPDAAGAKSGKRCPIPITDGLSGCHAAFKRVLGALKGRSMHLRGIHMWNGFPNANRRESADGTFAGHAGQARDINNRNSLVCRIFILYYYIRSHGGIDGKTSAKAAGIGDTGPQQIVDADTERGRGARSPSPPIVHSSGQTLPYAGRKPRRAAGMCWFRTIFGTRS